MITPYFTVTTPPKEDVQIKEPSFLVSQSIFSVDEPQFQCYGHTPSKTEVSLNSTKRKVYLSNKRNTSRSTYQIPEFFMRPSAPIFCSPTETLPPKVT